MRYPRLWQPGLVQLLLGIACVGGSGASAAEPNAAGKLVFSHIGIYTAHKKPGMHQVMGGRVWVSDFRKDPCHVEWLWVDADRPADRLPPPHVAFRVADIEAASKGLKPQGKPFDPGVFDIARVAFFDAADGANVELMEFKNTDCGAAQPAAAGPQWVFSHVGMITTEKKAHENFVASSRVWASDFGKHPYLIEWLRYEPDSPVTGPIRTEPHVAYEVDDIQVAAKGMKVLLEPFCPGVYGIALVGFFQNTDGAVVEFVKRIKPAGAD